jgi:hypothetical protein
MCWDVGSCRTMCQHQPSTADLLAGPCSNCYNTLQEWLDVLQPPTRNHARSLLVLGWVPLTGRHCQTLLLHSPAPRAGQV